MMSVRKLFFAVMLMVPVLGQAQLTYFPQDVTFETDSQGMWGPVLGSFTLDEEITLFDVPWDVSWDTGNAAIVSILGQQFGGSFNGNFSGVIGSEVRLEGFTTGQVDIDYPIRVDINYSQDETYDPGDQVRVNTDFVVRSPGYDMETRYPSAGEFFWDIYFQMAAGANAQLCVFGCTTFPIIPQFDTGLQTLNMVTASGNGASTNGNGSGIWFLGPGDPSTASALNPGLGPWPYSLEPQTSGPYNTTTLGATWVPWQCYISTFPAELPGAFGLSGELTLPFVPDAPESLNGTTLTSIEDSTYFTIQLELFQMIGGVLGMVPEPTLNTVGNVLSNLSGSQSLGVAEIEWNFFSAFFQGDITNKQRFTFNPTVSGLFQFPVAVDYEVRDSTNALVSSGNSSMISVDLGEDILYDYPCYYDSLVINQIYSIDGQFRNRTYDSVAFSFNMSALAFALEVPEITITPEINVPEICVPVPYPCPTWSNPFRWCTSTVCTPAFTIPAVVFPALNIDIGPVWETSIPLGDFQYDWFDQTWTMPGFTDQVGQPFSMVAYDYKATSSHVDNDCYGGSLGAVTVVIDAESDTTYTYSWTNGTTTTTALDNQTINNLPAGNYNVSIIDANGCQLFTGQTVEDPQDISFLISTTDITCNGANDGTLSVTAQGGTGALSYSIGGAPQASPNFTGLVPGTYTLTVEDANNCSKTATFSIDEPALLVQSGIVTDVNCNAGSDGAINVSVGGGTLPYNYSWSNGATSEDLSNITAGTYTLTITDGRSCTSIAPYTVNEPANPVALSATFTDVDCFDGADGAIDVTTTGGTPGYTYLWTSSGQGVLPFTAEDLTNLSADTYTVIATDVNGCTEQLTQVIDEPNAPLSSTPVLVDILCFGNATGSIDPVVAGGTTPYTYNWSTGSTAPSLSGLAAGTYTLNITDANGCTDQYTYTLTEPAAALAVTLTETDVLCFGDATGAVDADVTGGTAPYGFVWNNGATTEDINNLVAGTYDITVTDANTCVTTALVTVDQPAAPLVLSTTVVDVDCFGNNTGSIDVTVAGGTSGYEYYWSNGGFVVLSDTSQDLTNLPADDYTVIVTDANGCQETITATVTEPAAPLALSGIVDDVNCFGTSDGAIDATITGGTTPYTFNWSNGATTEDVNAIPAGTYTLTVTDDNGCTISDTWDVIQPAAPLNIDLFATAVECNGDNTGEIDATVTGGTMPYDYSWSNGEVTSDIENIPAGVYTLTVTDAQGCIAFTGITVDEPPLLTITPVITDVSCFGYSDGQIQINVAGGVQPYYFNWGNQNEILLNNPSETITGLPASDYFVRVRDENGCITEQTLTVGEPAPFLATSVVTDALCNGSPDGSIDMTVIGGTMPYTYQWSDGQTVEDPVNLTSGFYTYEFTDDQGCIISDSVYVDQPDEIQVTYFIDPVSCIDQSDAVIDVTTFGGTEPYSFLWTTGAISEDAADLAPGTYELTVTDDNLCTETFTFTVDANLSECLIVPNTFTPNGDNYNDTWVIGNIDLYPNVTVKVFNEWGNEIFTSVGAYDPWDGTHRGNALPAGVYYYIIVLNNNEDNKYTGTISIVR